VREKTAALRSAAADGRAQSSHTRALSARSVDTNAPRAAAALLLRNCLSTTASLSIEDVAAASPDCYRWFQLYVYKDHEKTKRLVQRATKEGYSAICLTVDLPVVREHRLTSQLTSQLTAQLTSQLTTQRTPRLAQPSGGGRGGRRCHRWHY
jgi:L-lactate dehydrogenase (cytochrome)